MTDTTKLAEAAVHTAAAAQKTAELAKLTVDAVAIWARAREARRLAALKALDEMIAAMRAASAKGVR